LNWLNDKMTFNGLTFYHGLVRKALLITLLPFIGVASALADDIKDNQHVVTDLGYGLVLFHYFQGDHQAALTQLAIIESKREVKHLGVSPELVKGGMSLSYGLYDEANDIFDRVSASESSLAVKSDAWFGSGKLQYLEGNWQAAEQDFERVDFAVSNEHKDDLYYFKAQLALKNNDVDAYHTFKSKISNGNELHGYLEHNFLLTKISTNTLSIDDLLVPQPQDSSQLNALADRSYLAMGYAFIALGSQDAAMSAFKKIALDSYLIEPALLGYGWALNNRGQYGQAKSLFARLAQGKDLNSYVQESILASAYASQLLGDLQSSLNTLASGIVKFDQQKTHLLVMQQQLSKGSDCYNAVVLQQSRLICDKGASGFNDLALIAMLSDSQFATSREQLQQVNELDVQFQRQLAKLKTYENMLADKQQTTQSRLGDIDLAQLKSKVDDFTAHRNKLSERIKAAKQDHMSTFFLPQTQLQHHNKISATVAKLEKLQNNGQKVNDLAQRLDLLRRSFLWQSDYNYAVNVNNTQQALNRLDTDLTALISMYQRFIKHVDQVANIDQEIAKIGELRQKITLQRQRSRRISARIEQDFKAKISEYFVQRHHVLDQNINAAKLAMIQMQDAAFKQSQQTLLPIQTSSEIGESQ